LSNVFQRSLEQIADRKLSEDIALLGSIWQLQLSLNAGHFERRWVDALFQTNRVRYDIYDAYGFAMLWSGLLRGEIAYAMCDLGRECGANKDDINAATLKSFTHISNGEGLSVRCQAEFWGGLYDCDGHFSWFDRPSPMAVRVAPALPI
jgi:hypothetical protein